MKKAALFSLVFFYTLGWRLGGSGALDISLIVSLCILFLTFNASYKILPHKFSFLFSCFSFLAMSFYVALTTYGLDLTLIPRGVRLPISILSGIGLALVLSRNRIGTDRVLFWIAISITINALVAILMSFNSGFRELTYSLTGALKILNETSTIESGVRAPGLTYGLSQTSVMQSIGVLILVLLYFNNEDRGIKSRLLYLIMILINIFGCLFIGRTGIVLSLFFMLCVCLTRIKNVFPLVATCLILAPAFMIFAQKEALDTEAIKVQIERAEEIAAIFTGEESHTLKVLTSMYHLPSGAEIVWGGNGMGRSEYFYTSSDVGYVRIIYAVGIVGLFIYMSYLLYFSLVGYELRRLPQSENLIACLFFILMVFFIYSFKELFFYSRNIWQITCLVFGMALVKNRDLFKRIPGSPKI